MIGNTLGHYQITGQIGKGGMGEVYRAKDQKLGRDVAIKVLPEEFARDAERLARFQREARMLASLNHPGIAAIHGLEESGGTQFLVLELVEGETLSDRVTHGSIPVEESLNLAMQIAEALEAAHERGIIHRDLKPANIKVTPEGKVKVLDFGLAKALAGEATEVNLSNSPTLSDIATQQGVILGTAAYMSPEQARGKPVDKRADIWAFGCIFFEMLTGCTAFSGRDATDILAAVIRSEPDWSRLPSNLHWRLREVLDRCVKKDAKNRYHDIYDVKLDIEKVLTDPNGVMARPVTPIEIRTRLRTVAAAVVLTAIVAGTAVWILKPTAPSEPRRVMRFDYHLPEDQQLSNLLYPVLAVPPDGGRFAYNTVGGLYLRSMDQSIARLILAADEHAMEPFFSPDSQWVGYWSQAENQLKKISVKGGAPVSITSVGGNPVLPSWNADDTIVYGQYGTDRIMRVSADGGTPELLCETNGQQIFAPQILPDGKSVLFSEWDGTEYRVIAQSLKSGQRKSLGTVQGTASRYVPTGHIVYAVGNNLFAVRFNPDRLEITGGAVSMVEGILWLKGAAAPQYDISKSGTLVYIEDVAGSVLSAQRSLVWVDRKGKEAPIAAQPNDYAYPRLSPDGTKVALAISSGAKSDIWILDVVRETITRLTFNEQSAIPLWTPDGKRVAFNSGYIGRQTVYWKAADGTGEEEKLSSEQPLQQPWSWSRNGKTLLLMEGGPVNSFIGTLSMEGDHKLKPLFRGKHSAGNPKISPDGRWMAYASIESGKAEVYVRPFPDVDKGNWQVSTSGGVDPLWSPDGRELFYRNGESVMAVAVQTETAFKPGKSEVLFQGKYDSSWDISHDGKRFLMIKPPASSGASPTAAGLRKINIVLNWTEELKQRVPGK